MSDRANLRTRLTEAARRITASNERAADMAGDTSLPAEVRELPAGLIVEADVREDLRAGREPFARIMAARRALPPGGALVVRAIFEPVPLYAVLGQQGFAHHTEKLAEDDWRVWFFGAERAGRAGDAGETRSTGEDAVTVLDVRGLEPPEPMMRTLAALESLAPGATLLQLNVRVPQFLLPLLEERGFTYEIREQAPDLVRVFIRRAAAGSAAS